MSLTNLYCTKCKLLQYCISFILLAGYSTTVFAQNEEEKGLPFITNYSPKTYKELPQTWCAIEDNQGLLYFGIQNGILEYDGVKWRRLKFKNTDPIVVRSLARDNQGRIYYGAIGDFGYLKLDSLGQTTTVSLLQYIPAAYRNFYDVWTIYVSGEGIYFQTREYIFRLNNKNEVKVWKPATKFMYAFYLDDNYYIHEQGLGLFKLVSDSLQLIPGSEFLGKERMQVMLPYTQPDDAEKATSKKQYLIGLFYTGLYLFDGKSFQPFASEATPLLKSGTLYKGAKTKNGNYALSTTGKGLLVIDPEGKIIQRINRDVGLQDESVYAVYSDSRGFLWLALDNGISRVDINSPFTQFTNQAGINTSTLAITRFQNDLFLGTTNGLLKFNATLQKFQAITSIPPNQTFALLKDSNQLLIPNDGLYSIQANKVQLIQPSVGGDMQLAGLMKPAKNPQILYAGATSGVKVFLKTATGWHFQGSVPHLEDQVWTFAENKDGSFWVGTQNAIVYRVRPVFNNHNEPVLKEFRVERFGTEQGFKSAIGNVYKVKGEAWFPADSFIYRFDEVKSRFVKDTSFGNFPKGGGRDEFYMVEDHKGRVWIRMGKETVLATPQPDGKYRLDKTQWLPMNDRTVQAIYPEDNGVVWICTSDGLVRFDEKVQKNYDAAYKTVLRRIVAGNQLLSTNTADSGFAIPALSFSQNSLRFEYAAPFFEQEDKIQYQTWLEGFETGWSGWDNNYYKEYTNLPDGKYTFHVRALNVYQKSSSEASYEFRVLAPWYRSWWAYTMYVLVALGIIYFLIRWRTYQLQQKHRELEQTVALRTGELSHRVEELAVINSVQEGLVREMNVQAIYSLVGKRIAELFDTQTVIIRTFDLQAETEHWQYAIEKGERLYSDPRPIMWANKQLIQTKQPLLINENYIETARKFGGTGVSKGLPPKAALFVPMTVGDMVRGSVSLQNVEKDNAFTESDIRLLTTFTNSMSVAIENARLFDETTRLLAEAKQRATELSTVNNISKALASQLDSDELIELVGHHIKDLFKANIVYLALLNQKNGIIYFPYQHGDAMPPMKLGEGLTSKIITTGEPLLINKDVEDLRTQLGVQRVGIPAASYLGVPIPVGDENIGVLSVQSTEQENRFDENDLRLLSTIAASVGVALRNAKLFEEVKQAKMEAEAASMAAEKANEAKSAFLSTVSHELRTPLTSVLGFTKIIRKRLVEKIFPIVSTADNKSEKIISQISENLNVVVAEGERLTHLINDVLDLAKIEAGKMEWNMEHVSMAEVAERALSATSALFEQKNLAVHKNIQPDLPPVLGDRDKLIQVVINLISNAVKFTDTGSVTCNVYSKKGELVVEIQDTGIGIASQDHAAVFEQFKQVGGDTLTDKPKGTGLGLPICKEIVEHHGGRIWLESAVGKGSTFAFALPLVKEEKSQPIHLNELVKQLKAQMAQSAIAIDGKNATILIVDDDDAIRSLLHQEFSDAGYLIEEAANGKEALEKIRVSKPDLIILDVMMPEMNGFDVAAILKNDPQTMEIPIIVLSIIQDKSRGYRIGVDRYLTKPIDTTQLFTEVGMLLEQGKSRKKVMVVDEDSAAVRSLTDVLQAKGYHVVASDGKELVENAIAAQPDIIILNSMQSGKNEVVQTLRFEKGLENVVFLMYQ